MSQVRRMVGEWRTRLDALAHRGWAGRAMPVVNCCEGGGGRVRERTSNLLLMYTPKSSRTQDKTTAVIARTHI